MEKIRMNDDSTRRMFINAFKENNIVPIIGSGFSANFRTRENGLVPNGNGLKEYMINKIETLGNDISKEELQNESFSFVAELFEANFENPLKDGIVQYFFRNYTNISINKVNQNNFLNEITWDYIYTLNIDTVVDRMSL